MPMPQRTRSSRASRWSSAAAVFAAWVHGTSMPAAASSSSTVRKRASCSPVKGLSGSSATAQWVKTDPSARCSAATTACTTARTSSGWAPTRCIPVSTFTWTCTCWSAAAATPSRRATPASVYTVASSRASTSSSSSATEASDSTSTGASIPAARSSAPSAASATASTSAPPARAARAEGTAPCP
jgi:hypothetical protein